MGRLPGREQMPEAGIAAWVLGRLSLARRYERTQEQEELLKLLALPEVSVRIFDKDERLAASLLAELPRAALAQHAGRLVRGFPELPDAVAAQAAIRLAELHPPGLAHLLMPHLEDMLGSCADVRLSGAMAAAGRAGPAGLALLDGLERLAGSRLTPYRMLHIGFLQAALRLDRPGTARALARLLEVDDATGFEVEGVLAQAFAELAPGSPMLALVTDLEERGYGYRFPDLPELFVPGAPIDELDAMAVLQYGIDLKAAFELLDRGAAPPRLVRFAHELSGALPTTCSGFGRKGAFLFTVAAAAAGFATDRPQLSGLTLQDLLDLYTCDLAELPCATALEAAITARATEADLPVLLAELATCVPFRGGERMVRLVARYPGPAVVEALAACLKEECDGKAAAAAAVELARQGDAALDRLVESFPGFDFSQRMRTLDILAAAATEAASSHMASLLAEVREDPFELALWCDAAVALGDPGLLDVLPDLAPPEVNEVRRVLEALSGVSGEECCKRALQGSNL